MRQFQFVALMLASIGIVSCGGGGGSSSTPEVKIGSVSGIAFDSELVGATVKISERSKTQYFGQDVTDSNGEFTIPISASRDIVLEIDSTSGAYEDEFTGRVDQEYFGQTQGALREYINYVPGTSIRTAPTIYTTLAANLADYLIEQGSAAPDAVKTANAEISNLIGADVEDTIPHNITKPPAADVTDSSIRYGFFCAAISALMATQTQIAPYARSIDFTAYAGADARDDGKLNESAKSNSFIFTGGYRHSLAIAMLQMAVSGRNQSGWTVGDIFPIASGFNEMASLVFEADSPATQLEDSRPVISNVSWGGGKFGTTFYGDVILTFQVLDIFGLEDVSVAVDNKNYEINDYQNPSMTLQTAQLSDGSHNVKIYARNQIGLEATDEIVVETINNGTAFTYVSPNPGTFVAGNINVAADIHDPSGVEKVEYYFDSTPTPFATLQKGDIGRYTATLNAKSYADGNHNITIRAYNGAAVETDKIVPIEIDNTDPTILFWNPENSYLSGDASILISHDSDADVIVTVGSEYLSKTGTSVNAGSALSNFEFNTTLVNAGGGKKYPDGGYSLTAKAVDRAGNTTISVREILIDNTPPSIAFVLPHNGETIKGEFYLDFSADDAIGFGNNPFELLIDGQHSAWIANTARRDTVNPQRYGQGVHTLTLIVMDASGKKSSANWQLNFDI